MRKLLMLFLMSLTVLYGIAQSRTVTGKVTDDKGNPVPNITITERATKKAAITASDGTFSITVSKPNSVLVISGIGYDVKEVNADRASELNSIVLNESTNSLSEVVVTGVGAATTKKKLGISVESITAKDLPKVSTASIDQALVGKIAGAQISSISGQPGQQASILLRGINTLSSTQPMIMVDGVQLQAGNNTNGSASNLSSRLSDIDLSNVERVEVVQGAAAATIYGAQGANGVIQIFTKRGMKNGRTSITVNSRASFDNVIRGKLRIAQNHFYPTDDQGYIIDADGNRVKPDAAGVWTIPEAVLESTSVNDKPFLETTYDHVDQLFKKNALTLNNSINVSGGKDKMDYSFTLSNTKQESILFGDYSRTNLSLNLGMELFKNFTLRTTSQLVYSNNSTGGITGQNNINSALGTALSTKQYYDLTAKDSLGNYIVNPELDNSINPFYNNQFRSYNAKNTRIIQGVNLNYKPFKFLEVDYKYGIDNYRFDYTNYVKYQLNTLTPGNGVDPVNGQLVFDRDNQTLQNSLLTLFLRADFEKDFHINVPIQSTTQVAYDWRKDAYQNITATGVGFSPFPPDNLSTATSQSNSENQTQKVTFGYLINQKFEYANLLGVSGGVRIDYSSAFGSGSKAFTFPRGDIYFRLSELLKSKTLYEFKLRGAYGEAGIQPGAYDRFITLSSGNIGAGGYLALKGTANNPLLDVEVSKESEVGVDLGIRTRELATWFSDIRLSATYWNRKSNDVIRAIDLAPSSGTLSILTNALSLSSHGFQASLDASMLKSENATWNFGIRFGKQKSIVSNISNHKDIVIGGSGSGQFVLREKESIGAFFGVQPLSRVDQASSKGDLYIPADEAADYEVVNGMVVNKTTKAVAFTNEQVKIGDPTPKFNMSFINDFTFLNKFSLSFQFDWVYGNQIYNQTNQWLYRDWLHGDFDKPVTIGGETKPFANYYNSLYFTNQTNAYFVETGSFLRLRDLSVGYNLSSVFNGNVVKTAQVTISARNLFTISNYSGFDPEASANLNDPTQRGLDLYAFPNFRTFQIGLNIGF